MRFFIPINDAADGESQTVHVVNTGSNSPRANKRILKQYFIKMGVDHKQVKTVMKKMGFWGDALRMQL